MTRRTFDLPILFFFISIRFARIHFPFCRFRLFRFQSCTYFGDWFGLSIAAGTLANFLVFHLVFRFFLLCRGQSREMRMHL